MSESAGPRRAKRLALIIIGALLLIAIPYGLTVHGAYERFTEYVTGTLENPDAPPRWTTEALEPEQCIDEAVVWGAACPGQWVFCDGGFQRVIRECMGSQDRGPWCAQHAEAWASTGFGFEQCKARVASAHGGARADAEDDHCPAAYRALAAHCKARGLRPGAR